MGTEHDGVGGVGLGDQSLVVLVHRRLGGAHHARAHLHAFGSQGEGGGHRNAVDDPAGRDDGKIEGPADLRQQDHGRDRSGALEASAFAAFDHEAVDSCVDGLLRGAQRRDHVEHGDPGVVELLRVAAPGRRPTW